MSWVRAVAVVFLWTLLPGIGWGADLQLGASGAAEYDSNVLRTESDEKDDFVFRITPKVWFIEDEGKFHWDLRYQMPWEKAVDTDRIDHLYHLLSASARHYVSQNTQVFFRNAFTYSESINTVSALDDLGAPTVGTFRRPVIRNGATLGVQHSFTPRLEGNLAFSHRIFESDVPYRSDNMVYVGNTNLHYALSSRHRLGGGAAATYQDLEASNDGRITPSQAFFLNVYGAWTWTIDETTMFELTGGPTFVKNEQDAPPFLVPDQQAIPYLEIGSNFFVYDFSSCGLVNGYPVLSRCALSTSGFTEAQQEEIKGFTTDLSFVDGSNVGGSSSSWTFFGEAALSKRWSPRLFSRLLYRRTESTASGAGSATLDLVSLITNWQISELWSAGLRADFAQRKSTAPVRETLVVVADANPPYSDYAGAAQSVGFTSRKVNRDLDTDRWGVSARMSRRLTKHLYASLRYTYNQQRSKADTAGRTSDFSNHLVTLGVQFDLDRWHLW